MRIKNLNAGGELSRLNKTSQKKTHTDKKSSEPQETVDLTSLYAKNEPSTREERISKSLAKAGVRLSESTREFSMAFVGTAIGSAVGSSLGYGGPLVGGAVGSAVGAIGGMVWEGYDVGGKIGNLFKKKEKKRDVEVSVNTSGVIGKGPSSEDGKKLFSSEISTPSPEISPSPGKKQSSPVLDTLKGSTEGLVKTMRAMPRFIYPCIYNATEAEKGLILSTLDSLPMSTVTSTPSITVSNLSDMGAAGVCYRRIFATPIELDKGEMAMEAWDARL